MPEDSPPKGLVLTNANLPVELLAEIGRVTVNWGHLTTIIEVAIWGMMRTTVKQGITLTNAFKFSGKMDIFTAYGMQFFKGNPELEEFKALRTRIFDCYTERNEIEHSIWWHHFGPGAPSTRVRIRKDLSIDPKFVEAKDVENVTQSIIKLVMDLDAFSQKHIPEPLKS